MQVKTGQASAWFKPDGTIDLNSFGATVDGLSNKALQHSLCWLKDAELKSGVDKVDYLRLCKGPGIMCAVAASLPHRYLEGSLLDAAGNINMPPESLEFDMRGRVHVDSKRGFGHVDIGEVKSRLSCADAVPQLGIRLNTIEWFVRETCNVPRGKNIMLVGRIVVPRGVVSDASVAADQRDKAQSEWNYSLYLHTF